MNSYSNMNAVFLNSVLIYSNEEIFYRNRDILMTALEIPLKNVETLIIFTKETQMLGERLSSQNN